MSELREYVCGDMFGEFVRFNLNHHLSKLEGVPRSNPLYQKISRRIRLGKKEFMFCFDQISFARRVSRQYGWIVKACKRICHVHQLTVKVILADTLLYEGRPVDNRRRNKILLVFSYERNDILNSGVQRDNRKVPGGFRSARKADRLGRVG